MPQVFRRPRKEALCWLGFHRVPAGNVHRTVWVFIYQTLNTVFEVAQAKSGKGELFHCLVVCRNQTLSAVFKNGSQGRMGRRVCPRVTPPIHLGALCSLMPARECICSAALRDKDWAHLTLSGTTAPFQVPNLEYFWIQAAGLGMSNQ